MGIERALFALFSAVAVASALGVVFLRDPLKAAVSLLGSTLVLAAVCVLQQAEFVATAGLMTCAAIVLSVMLFVQMFVPNTRAPILGVRLGDRLMIPIKAIGVLLVAGAIAVSVQRSSFEDARSKSKEFGTIPALAHHFFDSYGFQLEIAGVLLLTAGVGAVTLSQQTDSSNTEDRHAES